MDLLELFKFIGEQILNFWWIISPIALFFILQEVWLDYKIAKYLSEINWILLEVKLPRPLLRTSKAMDHIFTALHAIHAGNISFSEKYFEGKVQEWLSLEIVGSSKGIRFLIGLPDKFRNLVEAQVYAQYPDAEIQEVEDYTNYASADIPNQDYDLWGTELVLTQADAFPILTYPYFEAEKQEINIDPLSSLSEVLSLLKEGELIWIQTLAKPVDDKFNNWKEEGLKEIAKMTGRKVVVKSSGYNIEQVNSAIGDFVESMVGSGATASVEKKEIKKEIRLSPGEEFVARAIEFNVAKFGYEVQIRIIYIAPVGIFSKAQGAAIMGGFKQFSTQNLNGFKPNKAASLKAKWYDFSKEAVIQSKKKKLFELYKSRKFRLSSPMIFAGRKNENTFVLSTEELATIYHFPTGSIRAPVVTRVEAKKGEPPPILPVV